MLTGSSTAEVEAPLERVWRLVADVERAPERQGGLKAMRALERDRRAAIVCRPSAPGSGRSDPPSGSLTALPPLAWSEKGELNR